MRKELVRFLMIALIAALAGTLFLSLFQNRSFSPSVENFAWIDFVSIVAALLGTIALLFTTMNILTLHRNPSTLTVALLGFPNAGKTVYLTVLFDTLQRDSDGRITFTPYGSETIEKVYSDLNILAKREWLQRTKKEQVFFYRAIARVRGILPFRLADKRYKLEIADFAGEHLQELDPTTEDWLHKGEFFEYVIQSDVILLAIDVSVIKAGGTESLQNAFIAALQILIERKSVPEGEKLKAPVAILFLKSDLLMPMPTRQEQISLEVGQQDVIEDMHRLIQVCEKRCESFNYFFVSSIGNGTHGESPPSVLSPWNVAKPITWVLRRKARSFFSV